VVGATPHLNGRTTAIDGPAAATRSAQHGPRQREPPARDLAANDPGTEASGPGPANRAEDHDELERGTTTDTYERALMEAVGGIGEMAARVRRNGPERHYAAEKLSRALFKAAEALAIVGAERQIELEEANRGCQHGLWLAGRGR
jgi:hypothetical protein